MVFLKSAFATIAHFLMVFVQWDESELSDLRNLYVLWRIARPWQRPKIQSRLTAEKKRLRAAGVDSEALRLYSRYLCNPKDSDRRRALDNYLNQAAFDLVQGDQ